MTPKIELLIMSRNAIIAYHRIQADYFRHVAESSVSESEKVHAQVMVATHKCKENMHLRAQKRIHAFSKKAE